MNKREASELLSRELGNWRHRSYSRLASRVDAEPHVARVLGPSGASYQLEVQVIWDVSPGGNLRVLGAIDDGGIRALFPMTDGFLMAPDGAFVGE
jgi:hypothetical protein